jgi:hypothetical protein
MEQPKRRKPQLWQITCGRGTPGGSPVCLMPKPPSPNMRAGGGAAEDGDHAPGGITQSAIVGVALFIAVCRRSERRPWAREDLEDADVFAGDAPCTGEEIYRASARLYALQTLIN